MDGFAASGRVERVVLRLAGPTGDDARVERSLAIDATARDVSEVVEVHTAEPLGDRWATFRDRWSELTFYLFDPQSWR